MKRGLLFVAGVTDGNGGASLKVAIDRLAAQCLPGVEVRWAALHSPVHAAPRARGSRPLLLPRALKRMESEGFTRVVVQPLFVVDGSEFKRLRAIVERHRLSADRISRLSVGAPLLDSATDAERVARALLAGVAPTRKRGEALIAIGHGSATPAAGLAYLAAAWMLGSIDRLAFLGCVNSKPDLADVLRQCKAARVKRAILIPFTTATGSTLREALAPSGPKSWIAALAAEGIAAIARQQGLGENELVAEIWLHHAEMAL